MNEIDEWKTAKEDRERIMLRLPLATQRCDETGTRIVQVAFCSVNYQERDYWWLYQAINSPGMQAAIKAELRRRLDAHVETKRQSAANLIKEMLEGQEEKP